MGLEVRIRKTASCAVEGLNELHTHGSSCISKVEISDPPPVQHNFPTKWVTRMLLAGAITLSADMLSVGGHDYKIVRKPGAYCCHCGERIGDGPARTKDEAALRMAYVGTCDIANNDDDTADPNNPAGYEVIDYYDGEHI